MPRILTLVLPIALGPALVSAQVARHDLGIANAAPGALRAPWGFRSGQGYDAGFAPRPGHKGQQLLRLTRRPDTTAAEFGAVAYRLPAADLVNQVIRLDLTMRVRARGAGATGVVWIRANDSTGAPLQLTSTEPAEDRNPAWHTASVLALVPAETATLRLGAFLQGGDTLEIASAVLVVERDAQLRAARCPRTPTGRTLDSALTLIRQHGVVRGHPDLDRVLGMACRGAALSPSRPAAALVASALTSLGDRHTRVLGSLTPPTASGNEGAAVVAPPPRVERAAVGRAAYLRVPASPPMDASGTSALVDSLWAALQEQATSERCGWLIDLRGHDGGNLWPLAAGLGPLFGRDTAGAFVHPDGRREWWGYTASGAWLSGRRVAAGRAQPPTGIGRGRVAVLTDRGTASSAEALALALTSAEESRRFGLPTAGLTTAVEGFTLPDGSMLWLATSRFAGPDGTPVTGPLTVEPLPTTTAGTGDPMIEAAVAWIGQGAQCASS